MLFNFLTVIKKSVCLKLSNYFISAKKLSVLSEKIRKFAKLYSAKLFLKNNSQCFLIFNFISIRAVISKAVRMAHKKAI